MTLSWITKRLRMYWRLWGLLLLPMALISGFAIFVPLYSHTLSADHLTQRLDGLTPLDGQFILSHSQPFDPAIADLTPDRLGNLFISMEPFRRTTTQDLICGTPYAAGEATPDSAGGRHCHQIFAYDAGRLDALVTLTAGRFPQMIEDQPTSEETTSTPASIPPMSQIEIVIFSSIADRLNLVPGDFMVVGASDAFIARAEIVGILEPNAPDVPFWSGQEILTEGVFIPVGLDIRFDFSFVVLPEVFESVLKPTIPDNVIYVQRIQTEPQILTISQLEDRHVAWLLLEQQLTQIHPDIVITVSVDDFMADVLAEISTLGGTLLTVAGALIVMLSAPLFYFALAVLRQLSDWQTLADRGVRQRQLILMHLLTVVGVVITAGLIGLIAAPVWLLLLGRASGSGLPPELPLTAIILGLLVGVGIGLIINLAALFYLLMGRRFPARSPVDAPFVMRYYVDVILLLIGTGLLLRLYLFNNETRDPFDLLAPLILLAGGAIFVLRVIPVVSSVVAAFWKRGLSMPLTLWHFGRQPGYKSWGLVMLIFTLAIGIIQITLRETQTASWGETARQQTGGDVRVLFDDTGFLNTTPPDTALMTPVVYIRDRSSSLYTIIGINPQDFAALGDDPQWGEMVKPLIEAGKMLLPGLLIPEATTKLTLQVYSHPSDADADEDGDEDEIQVRLELLLRDGVGANVRLQMTGTDERNSGSFVPYEVDMPETGLPPFRLQGIQIRSQIPNNAAMFSHAINIDDLTAVDDQGQPTILADFEENRPEWQNSPEFRSGNVTYVHVGSVSTSGERSLVMNYRMTPGQDVIVPVAPQRVQPLPVLITSRVAEAFDTRTPLTKGIIEALNETLPLGLQNFSFQVAGIVPSFPTTAAREHVLIADAENLLWTLNNTRQRRTFYTWNQAWLKLTSLSPQPSAELQAYLESAPGVTSVDYLWERYNALGTQPLENALTGLLRVGFVVLLATTVLIFVIETQDRRESPLTTLVTIGGSVWQISLWRLIEVGVQALLAMIFALVGGGVVAGLLMQLLDASNGNALILPWSQFALGGIVVGVLLLLLVGLTIAWMWRGRKLYAVR